MLAINQIKTAVLQHLKNNVANMKKPLIISASTGTGKSSQLPLWCADFGKVLVIEPRRIACTSLANYVANQCDTKLGDKVGYAIRFEVVATEHTAITYVTPGVALRWLYEGKLNGYKVIMLDEFHERRWDTDLLLALLLEYQSHQLVITSATLNAEQLVNYTQGAHYHAAGKAYPVSEHYLACDTRDMPNKTNLSARILDAAQTALTIGKHDILAFLPGKNEIAQCASNLKASLGTELQVISLHGNSPIKEQQQALVTTDKRRIILATNVAETSLTIPGIDVVIDSGLERRTHIRNGQTVLDLAAIAQDSKQQRRGRAGRLKKGHYIALFGQNAPLGISTPPEIQREDLTDMMLASASNNVSLSALKFIDKPSQQALNTAKNRLIAIAAIDSDGCVTVHGKNLSPLPIDVELAHLISCMPNNQLKQAMVDLAAALSVPAKLYKLEENSDAHLALISEHPDLCDIALLIKLVREQLNDSLHIDPQALAEAQQYCKQLRDYFDLPPLVKSASWQIDPLRYAIAANLPKCVYVKKDNRRESYNNGQQEVVIACDSYLKHQPQCLLVLKTFSLAGKAIKDRKTLATVTSPLPLGVISEAQLGYAKLREVTLTDSSPTTLTGHYDYCYANKVINTYQAPINKQHFVDAVLILIQENKLCQDLFKQLLHEYELLNLYQQVHDSDWHFKPPQAHLSNLLNELNVSCLDELMLFDNSDFSYNLIDEYELKQFSADYPLEVQLPKQRLKVEYFITAKRVVLHYQSGQKVDAPKKWELPNFNGARIQYRRASKRVDIK